MTLDQISSEKKETRMQAAVCSHKQFRISLVFRSVARLFSFTTL